MDQPDDSADQLAATRAILPSEFMRQLRPDEFSDSGSEPAFILEAYELEQRLEYVTARNETHDFEIFCRKLCERIVCKNLKPATGPEGGGDSKADSETFAVSDEITTLHYVGEANSGSERWAFAFSAKKQWQQKARSDIEGIAATGRPYTKVFIATSRYGRSKDVAKIQDELSEKFGFRVEIFDRSWIIDRVLTHGNQDIAVDYLGVGKRNEKARVGPADYARSQQLEDLEKEIQDPAAYAGIEAQRVTDALLAATLSKELERPPFETHGRFERAIRIADQHGLLSQQIEARYQRLWTAFYWFDDFDLLDREFDAFAELALGSPAARHAERLANLLQCLITAVAQGYRSAEQVRLLERRSALVARLEFLAGQKDRPNNALEARTTSLMLEITSLAFDRRDEISPFWQEVEAILEAASGLAEYDAERLSQLIEEVGPLAGNDPAYGELVDKLAAFMGKRVGEGESGRILLRRARRLDTNADRLEIIRLLGRATHQLTKREYAEELIEASYMLAVAYRGTGTLWAARAAALFAVASIIADSEHDSHPSVTLVPALMLLIWIDIELRLLPEALDAIRMVNGCRKLLPLDDASKVRVDERLKEFDGVLTCQFLNSSADDFEVMAGLPTVLERLGLPMSCGALLYALGYAERLGERQPEEEPEGGLEGMFARAANQPAGDLGGRPLVTGSPQPHSIETRVIGMRVAVHLSGSDTALLAGQTLLAVIDTLFATVIGLRIGAFVERFDIDLVESDVATAPSVDFDGNNMRAKLHWPAGSTPADHLGESGTHSQFLLLSTLMLVATSLADRQKISLEKLFREESLLERVSAAVASSNSRIRAMNSPASRLTDWNELSLERFPPKADRPVIVRVPEADPEEETISERYATGDHRSVEVRSILDIPQWEQARWIGVMLGLQHDLPIVGLHFEDREAGRQIFERWRERFGARDVEGAIHIAILRELPGRPPSHYAVLLMAGTEPGDFAGTLVSMPSRLKLLEPAADTNLRFFLDNYPAGGSFILVPTYVKENGEPDLMMDLAILKHDLSIRRVADIGKSDLEIIGVQLLEQMEARDGSPP
ncbi:hypothetical protein [uncultured Sphingopyxis sp.]|jgi:hypothetical protein|uniref:hypothetical protein n=1 Tax=uncultured Sphingopyxis sp. TaxID=310581 RepID=UPI000AA4EC46|nr:hypothetical protein [uncultured Sphingopyxis sp.]MBN8845160.1 hypothetical protein [Sphingomonadales bacterium]